MAAKILLSIGSYLRFSVLFNTGNAYQKNYRHFFCLVIVLFPFYIICNQEYSFLYHQNSNYIYVTVTSAINSKVAIFTVLKNPISCPCTAAGQVVIKHLYSNSRNEFFCFGCHVVVVVVDTCPFLFRARVFFFQIKTVE